MQEIPIINVGGLFTNNDKERIYIDQQIAKAAFDIGFMVIKGYPKDLRVNQNERDIILKLFSIPEDKQKPYWKRNFQPNNSHIYRGWFPLKSSKARNREGFEIGPDIVRKLPKNSVNDILYEPTPIPNSHDLPTNWREVTRNYYLGMEKIGNLILDSLSRSLNISQNIFRDAFRDGISTLRLLHYPKNTAQLNKEEDIPDRYTRFKGQIYEQTARSHVDSGLLTLLAQCGVSGLQAQNKKTKWIDVPIIEDSFSINFGGLLELWTGGKIKATKHRVIGRGESRFSVPFFFEPRPNTVIKPLPINGIRKFKPFFYGDHLWATTTKFPENFGLLSLRPHQGKYENPN